MDRYPGGIIKKLRERGIFYRNSTTGDLMLHAAHHIELIEREKAIIIKDYSRTLKLLDKTLKLLDKEELKLDNLRIACNKAYESLKEVPHSGQAMDILWNAMYGDEEK